MSTSMPSHSPLLLVALKPDTPSDRPHCTNPLLLTASRVGPARAAWDAHASAMAPAIEAICRFMIAAPLSVSARPGGHCGPREAHGLHPGGSRLGREITPSLAGGHGDWLVFSRGGYSYSCLCGGGAACA